MNGKFSLLDHFVSVSEFSQGKANKIFNDVAEHNQDYVVMKNNKPAAVVVSVVRYEDMNERIRRMEALIEKICDLYLLQVAETRGTEGGIPFETAIQEEGFSMEELELLAESVKIE